MTRLFLSMLICSLTLFACKNDTATNSSTNLPSNASTPKTSQPKMKDSSSSSSIDSKRRANVEAKVRKSICGIMVKSVNLNDSNLSIEYFKDADECVKVTKNKKMTDELFKKYWTNASRSKKVMTLVPAQMLHEFDDLKTVDITIHTGEKSLIANINRDKLAGFVGKSWKEIQSDWVNLYRMVVVNNAAKREAFVKQFVTIE